MCCAVSTREKTKQKTKNRSENNKNKRVLQALKPLLGSAWPPELLASKTPPTCPVTLSSRIKCVVLFTVRTCNMGLSEREQTNKEKNQCNHIEPNLECKSCVVPQLMKLVHRNLCPKRKKKKERKEEEEEEVRKRKKKKKKNNNNNNNNNNIKNNNNNSN